MLHLPRWVYTSICQHFVGKTNIKIISDWSSSDTEWPLVLVDDDSDIPNVNNLLLRMDGPYINEVSRGWYDIEVEINVLVSAYHSDIDYSAIHVGVGIAAAAFDGILIKKYGDDESLVGCLTLKNTPRSKDERLNVHHFGQIDKDLRLYQACVVGSYCTQIEL